MRKLKREKKERDRERDLIGAKLISGVDYLKSRRKQLDWKHVSKSVIKES